MNRKTLGLTSMMAAISLLAAGCGSSGSTGGEAGGPVKQETQEPITLFFYTAQNGNYAKEENFQKEIGNVITAKFPHITIKHKHRSKGQEYNDLIAAGEVPDIILESSNFIANNIIGNGLQYDLEEMIKKYKFDVGRIQNRVLQQMKNSNPAGKVYGLPFSVNAVITFYNKDIFDKFGVPYPTDGMNWDETYELAKRLTRTEGGTAYHGFQAHEPLFMSYNQLSIHPLSMKEDKAAVMTGDWSRLFTDRKRFYEIPGNTTVSIDDFPKGYIAMAPHVSEKLITWPQANQALNWDVVSLPSNKDKPKTGLQANAYYLFITQTSKHKDQAFQVIDYLLSDEVQKQASKLGILTPLVSKEVQDSFGESIPHLKGKNLKSAFYNEYAAPAPARADGLFYYNAANDVNKAFSDMFKNNLDVNTALRQADEAINKGIQEQKAKAGSAK